MKNRLTVLFSIMVLASCSRVISDADINVIPHPQSVEMTGRIFDKACLDKVEYVTDAEMSPEAYELQIKKNRIIIRSSDDAGLFYAHQTLRQLSEAEVMYCRTRMDSSGESGL